MWNDRKNLSGARCEAGAETENTGKGRKPEMKKTWLLLLFLPVLLCSCVDKEIIKYDPPGMLVVTETGEYYATRFGYKWEQDRTEEAVDYVDPLTYEYTPIGMHEGEACFLRFGDEEYAPEMYIIRFYPSNGGEKQIIDYTINYRGTDSRFAGNYSVELPPVTESGIYTVEAVWPEWITNSIVTDATYGFEVTVPDTP